VVSVEIVETKDIDVAPIYLRKGDTFHVSHSLEGGPSRELLTHTMEENLVVNRVSVIKVKDEFGFKTAIGAVFGEKA